MSLLLTQLTRNDLENDYVDLFKKKGKNKYVRTNGNSLKIAAFEENEKKEYSIMVNKTFTENNFIEFEFDNMNVSTNYCYLVFSSGNWGGTAGEIYNQGIFEFITSVDFYLGGKKFTSYHSGMVLYNDLMNMDLEMREMIKGLNNQFAEITGCHNTTYDFIIPIRMPNFRKLPSQQIVNGLFDASFRIRINTGSFTVLGDSTGGAISITNTKLINEEILQTDLEMEKTKKSREGKRTVFREIHVMEGEFTTAGSAYDLEIDISELGNLPLVKLDLYVIENAHLTSSTALDRFETLTPDKLTNTSIKNGSKYIKDFSSNNNLIFVDNLKSGNKSLDIPFPITGTGVYSFDSMSMVFDDDYYNEEMLPVPFYTGKWKNLKFEVNLRNMVQAAALYNYYLVVETVKLGKVFSTYIEV